MDRLSHPNLRRPACTASANGKLAQTRIDKPTASLSIPKGIGMKNDNASKAPMSFQKNLGNFILGNRIEAAPPN